MAIANNKDLTHVVRTTQQWESSYDKYECIPEGVLCIEFTTAGQALAKIGNGRDIFSKLPYIGGADLTNYFTKEQTTECINDILKAKRYICIKGILNNKNQLPTNATCGDLYFVISDNQSSSNKYDEYVYSPNNTWEPLGSIPIDIDLSEYAKIVYVDEKIDEVNERIDDIEQHGTHTHANKDILDLITAAFTAEEKDKLSTLYNYDDTELRELITQASHTHSNKDILDAISAAFTAEDRVKLDSLTPYDDSILKEKITALERLAHEHSNKRILDRTTASFTTEYERKMRWIRIYTGCTGMEEGIAGLVPAAQAGEEDYVLSGSGEWVPQTGGGGTYELPIATTTTLGGIKVGDGLEIDANGKLSVVGGGGGGDSIAEGDGITITTDPQTGIKTISVNTGNGLQINQDGEVEIDPSIIPEVMEYNAGEAIAIRDVSQILPAGYVEVDYIEGIGNYTVINYIPNRKTKIVGTAMMIDTSYDPVVFGTRTGSAGQQFVFWFNRYDSTQAKVGFVYGTNTWSTPSDCDNGKIISYTLGDQFTFLISLDDEFNINDSFVHNITENGAPAYNLKLGIFALVNSSSDEIESSNQFFRGRIYKFKIYEDDELVVNLIPAVSTSNNQSGFYDVINDIFYTSKTATPFGYDPSTIHSTGKVIDVNYGNGLTVNQDNELEVNIGDGLSVNANNEVELTKATANALGGIKIGSGFVYTSDGLLNATPAAPPFDAGDGLELIYDDIDALPNGYGHVDYISSNPASDSTSNTNYGRARTLIDYTPENVTKLEIKMARDNEYQDSCFVGCRVSGSANQFVLWHENRSSQTQVAFVYGSQTYDNVKANVSYVTGQVQEIEANIPPSGTSDNITVSVNGNVVKTYAKTGSPLAYKLGIFQSNRANEWEYQISNGRIYYLRLYEGNTLVVNLVPAVRLSDETVGFYDNVNDKFYTSLTDYPFTTDMSTLVIDGAHRTLNTKYSNGLILNQNNELEVNIGTGLEFDQTTGAINVIGGGGGETYDAGDGIEITEVTHEDEFRVQNQEYFFTDHGLTCILTGNYGPRTFTKINDGDIVAAVIGTTGGWYMPLFVGLTEDSVKYSNSYDSNILGPNGSFTYHDKTWYYTADYALTAGDGVDHAGHLQSMTDTIYDGTEGKIQAAKDLIDLAVLLSDVSTPTISAKIGAGLSFDANGAIQADAQPLSPATDSTLGGVIVGEGINVDEYGEISLSAGEGLDIDVISTLPSAYTQVKAISSTLNGNQYIDTGYKFNSNAVIKMTGTFYKRNSSDAWVIPLGARSTHSYADDGILLITTWSTDIPSTGPDTPALWILRSIYNYPPSDKINDFYNDIIEIEITSNALTYTNTRTGVQATITSTSSIPAATPANLYLFATNDAGSANFFGVIDLYSFQIFEGSTEVIHYVPCKRNSDNVYGVYDTVNDEFKVSPNNALFTYVQGTPTGDDLIQQIKLLPATENTIGGVKPGDGILVDSDGTISVDPTIIPEVTEYEAGTAISIEDVEHGGVIFDAWDSGTGWSNWAYTTSTGDSGISWNPEVHSSVADSWKIPAGAIQVRAKALSTSDVLLHPTMHWLTDKGTGRFGNSCPTGSMPYDSWIDVDSNAVYMNLGIRRSEGSNAALNLSEIKSVELTFQTVSEIEVDVWTGVTGWTNGDYYDGTSDQFTSWPYTYHYNPSEYIPVPEGALKIRVIGISNENDSHFEGGGANIFDSNHHHIGWLSCCTVTDEWIDIPEGTVYVQPEVKWNNNNTRTISAADIKSVTLAWKLPALEINQAINVKYGDGLTVNQNNELEVNLGSGLQFDANGAIEVVGGGSSGGNGDYTAGDAIEFRSTQLSFNVDAIRWDISNIKSTSQTSGPWTQVRYIEFCDDTDTPYTISSASGIWEDNTSITYSTTGGSQTINDMIANTRKMCAIWRYPDHTMQLTFNLDTAVPCADIAKFRIKLGDDAPERDPKSWKVYFRDAATQIWYIVQDITNAELSDTRDIWSNYYSFDITGATSINVKYGTGLAIDPITGELFVDGQLPEGTIIKKLTYVGDGSTTNSNIHFSKKPLSILSLNGSVGQNYGSVISTPIDAPYLHGVWGGSTGSGTSFRSSMSYDDTTNTLSIQNTSDVGLAFNISGATYTMFYLVKGHAGSGTSENNEVSVIKSFTYVGDGNATNTIQFPETPDTLITIYGVAVNNDISSNTVPITARYLMGEYGSGGSERYGVVSCNMSFNNTTNILTLTGGIDAGARYNVSGETYTVVYSINEVIASSNYVEGDGIEIDPVTGEISVNIGTGLAFDPQTGAINVTGGGGGSGDTVAEGDGISITTDQQTGDKVIAVNAGSGLQVNQTTNELEVSSGVVTSIAPTQNTPGSITVTEGDGTATPVSVISQMGSATSSTAGTAGYVPAPSSGDDDAYLRGDGTWDDSVLTDDDELTLVFVPDDYQPS